MTPTTTTPIGRCWATRQWLVVVMAAAMAPTVCQGQILPPILPSVEQVEYADPVDGTQLVGFISLPEDTSTPVPALIFLPDANGNDAYEQTRATMIAQEAGYVGFAADIYGAIDNPVPVTENARDLIGFYRNDNPDIYMRRIQAAVDTVKSLAQVDDTKIALAGYCFGGSGVLMYALDDLSAGVAAVASFHGGLGAHIFDTNATLVENRPRVLVLSGGEDDAPLDIMTLEDHLDEQVDMWEITRYSGIEHAWTVFTDARYNQWADERSWASMVEFLQETFGDVVFESNQPDVLNVENVTYTDDTDGKALQGYLATPADTSTPAPTIVIIPDWDGVNQYEKERATLFAELGYVAFAADIYGADLQENLDIATRSEQATLYRSTNVDLFVSRMQRAVELVQEYDFVDSDNIAIVGYCFGGTGVIQYAFMGRDDVKLVAAFHGNVQEQFLPPIREDIIPYTMILSGGEDDAHGNQTTLEANLNERNADWEISRYSGVVHGFTDWNNPEAYNLNADSRSWSAVQTAIQKIMLGEVLPGNGDADDDNDDEDPVDTPSDPSLAPAAAPTDGDAEEDTSDGVSLLGGNGKSLALLWITTAPVVALWSVWA